ncbi:YncE family protein [Tepidamorphus sp. 3E244]|uniref:YncE family protein n=1 Tax=Tepidamorphus sp. 3E244 TaxID=3385498 RepID=UPI0038FC2422
MSNPNVTSPARIEGFFAGIEPDMTPECAEMVARLGRTEDVCLSPDNTKMAVAGYTEGSCCIFSIAFDHSGNVPKVALTGWTELRSAELKEPHGMVFVGEDHLIVGNRSGGVTVLDVSGADFACTAKEIEPIRTITRGNLLHRLHSPGSLCATRAEDGRIEIFVCNNYKHRITRHRFPLRPGPALPDNAIVLEQEIKVPDGIAVDETGRWIAVSNFGTHEVLIFDREVGFNRKAKPVGRCRGMDYPHGIRFIEGGNTLCVSDSGAPVVRFFRSNDGDWAGIHEPVREVQVLDDDSFQRGRHNESEGGPKGVAINAQGDVMAITCEEQALAFFHLPALLNPDLET